jgi:hypothetical protein
MKNLLKLLPFLVIAIALKACTAGTYDNEVLEADLESNLTSLAFDNNCANDLPKTRLINNGTVAFQLQVISEDGVPEITIPNIGPGVTTNWNNFNSGDMLFSVTNSEPMVSDEKVNIQMDTCMAYEIVINSNNQITSFIPISF